MTHQEYVPPRRQPAAPTHPPAPRRRRRTRELHVEFASPLCLPPRLEPWERELLERDLATLLGPSAQSVTPIREEPSDGQKA